MSGVRFVLPIFVSVMRGLHKVTPWTILLSKQRPVYGAPGLVLCSISCVSLLNFILPSFQLEVARMPKHFSKHTSQCLLLLRFMFSGRFIRRRDGFEQWRWILSSGRREMNLHELRQQEIEERQSWGPFKRYDNRNTYLIVGFISGSAERVPFLYLLVCCIFSDIFL